MTAPGPFEDAVFCEGYHDRAFWSAWLQHLGAASKKVGTRSDVLNP